MSDPVFYHNTSIQYTILVFDILGFMLIFFTFWIDITVVSKRFIYHY